MLHSVTRIFDLKFNFTEKSYFLIYIDSKY